MTPKEKAEQLFNKVPEVASHICENSIKAFKDNKNIKGVEYWEEVKEEVLKLQED